MMRTFKPVLWLCGCTAAIAVFVAATILAPKSKGSDRAKRRKDPRPSPGWPAQRPYRRKRCCTCSRASCSRPASAPSRPNAGPSRKPPLTEAPITCTRSFFFAATVSWARAGNARKSERQSSGSRRSIRGSLGVRSSAACPTRRLRHQPLREGQPNRPGNV